MVLFSLRSLYSTFFCPDVTFAFLLNFDFQKRYRKDSVLEVTNGRRLSRAPRTNSGSEFDTPAKPRFSGVGRMETNIAVMNVLVSLIYLRCTPEIIFFITFNISCVVRCVGVTQTLNVGSFLYIFPHPFFP